MSTIPPPAARWPRFLCPREGAYSLADAGFLVDPSHPTHRYLQSDVTSIDAITQRPCVVLLGEPGIGKSVALEEMVAAAADTGPVARHDLSRFTSDDLLVRRVFEANDVATWRGDGSSTLTLALDGLDECLLRIDTMAALLADELRALPCDRLRLRITCRTAVWPALLEDRLRDLFSDEAVGVYEILPLRRADVRAAAVARGVDPDTFQQEVVRREAVPLAIRPVTLNFLLAAYSAGRGLPASQAELYRRGCEHLCRERSPTRVASGKTGELTDGQRLAVAGRIAATVLVCGCPVIDTSSGDADPADGSVSLRDLIGGSETGDGIELPVTESSIREVLDTALFTARGPGLLGFAHQTYAEFLAADYLTTRGMPPDQALRLVTYPSAEGGVDRVVPQLREVAAWLATLRPSLFHPLIAADPEVLLGCDLPGMDPGFRAGLVAALLARARAGRFVDTDFGSRTRYTRLAHPGLADQLRPTIADRNALAVARRVAVDIAEACDIRTLADTLLGVVLDPTDDHHVRVQAAYAVVRIGGDADRAQLSPYVAGVPDDPDDELKGVALAALFPSRLSAADAFTALTPPKRANLYGAYAAFHHHHLPDHLAPIDLPIALAWVAGQPDTVPHLGPFEQLTDRVLSMARDHFDDPAVLAGYARVAAARIRRYLPAPGMGRGEEGLDAVRRWRLVNALLPVLRAAEDDPRILLWTDGPLLTQADAQAIIDRTVREPDPAVREYLARLAAAVHGFDADATARMIAGSRACPELSRVFAPRLEHIRLDSDEARRMREDYQRYLRQEQEFEERARQFRRPVPTVPPSEVVARILGEIEAGDAVAWWRLNYALRYHPDGSAAQEYEPDLTALPGWTEAIPEVRSRIVAAARRYLTEVVPSPGEWLGTNRVDRPDWAGFRALWLLDREAPAVLDALPADAWRRWGPVAVGYPCQHNDGRLERHRDLVRRAYAAAPDAVADAVEIVTDRGRRRGWVGIHNLVRGWLDTRLAGALLRHVRADRLSDHDRLSLLDVLLEAADPATVTYLESLVTDPPPRAGSRRRRRAVESAVLLLSRTPAAGWPVVWAATRRNAGFGREVFLELADRWDAVRSAFALGQGLSEEQVADLYVWLVREFPAADDPHPDGAHVVTARESVGQFRDRLITTLRDRGTAAAIAAIERAGRELPELWWLGWVAEQARQAALRVTWRPPSPAELRRLVGDPRARIVETGEQLLAVLRESLARLEAELQGETPAAPDLWNQDKDGRWTPKGEAYLSDYIARYLRRDLTGCVVVNREVEIRRGEGDAMGERTDLLVTAICRSDSRADTLSAVVEVKGCWNRGRETDLTGQLRDRYLRENRCRHGLYVVGWYVCEQWHAEDRQRRRAPTSPLAEARSQFAELAQAASGDAAIIEAVVLNTALR